MNWLDTNAKMPFRQVNLICSTKEPLGQELISTPSHLYINSLVIDKNSVFLSALWNTSNSLGTLS